MAKAYQPAYLFAWQSACLLQCQNSNLPCLYFLLVRPSDCLLSDFFLHKLGMYFDKASSTQRNIKASLDQYDLTNNSNCRFLISTFFNLIIPTTHSSITLNQAIIISLGSPFQFFLFVVNTFPFAIFYLPLPSLLKAYRLSSHLLLRNLSLLVFSPLRSFYFVLFLLISVSFTNILFLLSCHLLFFLVLFFLSCSFLSFLLSYHTNFFLLFSIEPLFSLILLFHIISHFSLIFPISAFIFILVLSPISPLLFPLFLLSPVLSLFLHHPLFLLLLILLILLFTFNVFPPIIILIILRIIVLFLVSFLYSFPSFFFSNPPISPMTTDERHFPGLKNIGIWECQSSWICNFGNNPRDRMASTVTEVVSTTSRQCSTSLECQNCIWQDT